MESRQLVIRQALVCSCCLRLWKHGTLYLPKGQTQRTLECGRPTKCGRHTTHTCGRLQVPGVYKIRFVGQQTVQTGLVSTIDQEVDPVDVLLSAASSP